MMSALPVATRDDDVTRAARTTALLADVSLEAVMPPPGELHVAAASLPTGTAIYLTDLPGRPLDKLIEVATGAFMRGLKPVPHIAARNVSSRESFDELLARLSGAANIRCVMLIGGDRDRPAGPYASASDLIESGLLQRHGIETIGIAGYPEGHPVISDAALDEALRAKLDAAACAGLRAHIVTQFAFDAAPVVDWIAKLRRSGIDSPVRIGMAGPANIPSLLKFAQRCGVRASTRGFARHAGSIGRLIGRATPADMLLDLADAGNLGAVAVHIYSFGGLAQAARWVRDAKAGRIV